MKTGPLLTNITNNANILEVNPQEKKTSSMKMSKELRKLRKRILMHIKRMHKAVNTII